MDNLNVHQFHIDFVNDKVNYHKKKSGLKTELISRAVGSGRYGKKILDISAGLGIDAIFLSQMGYDVTAIERNQIIYDKLRQAWLELPEVAKLNVRFFYAESIEYLQNVNDEFDVIYFDPMFPEKKKSALSKKEMVIFRQLVGDDSDAAHVLESVLQNSNIKRVVVKRPIKSSWLFKKPNHQLMGKLIRFDIYQPKEVKK